MIEGRDDENREMPGRKDDENKQRWDLLPHRALASVVAVLTHGAARYGAENWRRVPEPRRRYYAAALRHLTAWWMCPEDPDERSGPDEMGEVEDPDSGLPHLAHAVSCLLFLLELELAASKPRIPRRESEVLPAASKPRIPRRESEVLPAGRHLAYARGVAHD